MEERGPSYRESVWKLVYCAIKLTNIVVEADFEKVAEFGNEERIHFVLLQVLNH